MVDVRNSYCENYKKKILYSWIILSDGIISTYIFHIMYEAMADTMIWSIQFLFSLNYPDILFSKITRVIFYNTNTIAITAYGIVKHSKLFIR